MSILNWLFNTIPKHDNKANTRGSGNTHMSSQNVVSGDVHMATMKIAKMLNSSGEDFCTIFSAIECADTPSELEQALHRFNQIMRILFVAVPDIEHNGFILDALKNLKCSKRFESYLDSSPTVKDAISKYKTEIVKKLNVDFQRREELVRQDKTFDKALLSCYITQTKPELSHPNQTSVHITLPESDQNYGERENKLESTNKRTWQEQPDLDRLSHSKKRKLRDRRIDSEKQSRCSNHSRGTCRRGSSCRYRH